MSTVIDEFITRAREVDLATAASNLNLIIRPRGQEHAQPCPACGGKDRFSFNPQKRVWNCRGAGAGGHDAIGMAAHVLGLDLARRDGFLEACAAVLGEHIPDGGERESDEDRAARQQRLDQAKQKSAAEARRREQEAESYRQRERDQARKLYEQAIPVGGNGIVAHYLRGRGAAHPPQSHLRMAPVAIYWHKGEGGRHAELWKGPAMLGAFIDVRRVIIGCHLTYIDLANLPKLRPTLADPNTGELLPTKKMRGTKKGGLIPLCGKSSALRWVGGEGIENALAYAAWEGFDPDTFYFAAGDLGNLAGPADPASRFPHPTLTTRDAKDRERRVMVQGTKPRADMQPGEAMWINDAVRELVLLGDGDSEPVMTAAAMARARTRLAAPGRQVLLLWPRKGGDFSQMAQEAAYA